MIHKKVIVAIALFCCSLMAFDSFAQGRRGGHGPFKLIEANQAALQLTAEQQSQLTALKEQTKAEHQNLRKSEREDRRAQKEAMREKLDQALSGILTEAQMTQLTTLRNEKMEERRAKMAERFEKRKQHKEARKAYFEKNQLPVLQAQRNKLESSISNEDKALIEDLRAKAKAEKAKREAERKAKREAFMNGESKVGFHGKGHHKGKRGKGHQLFADEADQNAAKALVEKYNTEIDALHDEISEQKKQWKAELKALKESNRSEKGQKCEDCAGKRKRGSKGATRGGRKAKKDLHRKIKFLLMEPGANIPANELSIVDHQLSAYPNPATNQQTIEFELKNSGMVKVDLLDKEGRVVKAVFQGQLDAGRQQMNVNLDEVKGYVFYYRIIDQEGTSSLQVLLKGE